MSHQKPLLLFLLIVLSAFNVQTSRTYISRWVINKECSIKVGGSTNVNKFSCVISGHFKPDTLTFYNESKSGTIKITGGLKLDVQAFDCHNPVMTRDLRKTLKVKEFPKLTISFISLNRYPNFNAGTDMVKGVVAIELAGKTKRYHVDLKSISTGARSLKLAGIRKLNFSDFDIIPPRKIGGMIKTHNELEVEFKLDIKILN